MDVHVVDQTAETFIMAAFAVFCRYGVKRSTMNDIATEAGVARQTLYNSFSNKDDVLRGLIRLYYERAILEIKTGCANRPDLAARLDLLFEHIAINPYDLMSETPHAADIQDGFNTAGQFENAAGLSRVRIVISEMLEPYEVQIFAAGHTVATLSEFVLISAKAAKGHATSREHLLTLIGTLKAVIIGIATPTG